MSYVKQKAPAILPVTVGYAPANKELQSSKYSEDVYSTSNLVDFGPGPGPGPGDGDGDGRSGGGAGAAGRVGGRVCRLPRRQSAAGSEDPGVVAAAAMQ